MKVSPQPALTEDITRQAPDIDENTDMDTTNSILDMKWFTGESSPHTQ